jgi:hypothetical protein
MRMAAESLWRMQGPLGKLGHTGPDKSSPYDRMEKFGEYVPYFSNTSLVGIRLRVRISCTVQTRYLSDHSPLVHDYHGRLDQ